MSLASLGALMAFTPLVAGSSFAAFVGTYAGATALWLLTMKRTRTPSLETTLILAALFRLVLFGSSPALSDDVLRYLWDGTLLESGRNPYAYTPDDAFLIALREPWHSRINNPEIPTIYPPVAQVLFFLSAVAGGSLFAWRLLLLAIDLVTIRLLHRSSPFAAFGWATMPLVLYEGFWSAHVEIAAASLLFAAWSVLERQRSFTAGTLLGAAVSVKVVPFAAAPVLLKIASPKWRFGTGLTLVAVLPAIPFLLAGAFMKGFRDYATRWSFNSPLYDLVRLVIDNVGAAEWLKGFWTMIKDPLHAERVSDFVYRQLYTEMLTRVFLGCVFVIALVLIYRRVADPARAISWSVATLLLLSPTIHPWYWLSVLPFALVTKDRLLVSLALMSPFSYLLYESGVPGAAVMAVCYGIPLIVTWRSPDGPLSPK